MASPQGDAVVAYCLGPLFSLDDLKFDTYRGYSGRRIDVPGLYQGYWCNKAALDWCETETQGRMDSAYMIASNELSQAGRY
jgi:hypothetical protein